MVALVQAMAIVLVTGNLVAVDKVSLVAQAASIEVLLQVILVLLTELVQLAAEQTMVVQVQAHQAACV